MQAGYDYMLLRNHLQHRFVRSVGVFFFVLGALMVAGGSGYYAYASIARAGLDELNVSVPGYEMSGYWGWGSGNSLFNHEASESTKGAVSPVTYAEPWFLEPDVSSQYLFPVASLPAQPTYGLAYDLASYVQESLPRSFTPLHINRGLPVGSQGPAGRVRMPAIGLDSGVVPLGIQDLGDSRTYETPNRAVGHIPESARPGEAGSAWFFGHLETPLQGEGAVFRDLPKIPGMLRRGEDVYIIADSGAKEYLYRATSTEVVHQNQMALYNTGQATIHLVACVPSLVYDYRLIVTGRLVGVR